MNYSYPSDITREKFNTVASTLEGARKHTKPRTLDLYDIFNALLYVVNTGCQWRSLPSDYPKWRSVHNYFSIWSKKKSNEEESVLDKVLKKISRRRAYQKWQKTLYEHGYC